MPRSTAADLLELHRRALAATERIVAGIGRDQWQRPTPCTDWDVRTVLNHIVSENLWVPELMAGKTIEEVGDRFEGDVLGQDPLAAYRASAQAAAEAFATPGALRRAIPVSYGPVPGSVYAGHRFLDVLVHGWDLASGTDQDARLDPELVLALWELVVQPERAGLQHSGVFGAPVPTPAEADTQSRLLGALGRRAEPGTGRWSAV